MKLKDEMKDVRTDEGAEEDEPVENGEDDLDVEKLEGMQVVDPAPLQFRRVGRPALLTVVNSHFQLIRTILNTGLVVVGDWCL